MDLSSELTNSQQFKDLSIDEQMERMCKAFEGLTIDEDRKKNREEEECQRLQKQKPIIVKMTVPPNHLGLVAGKQFANKHRLETTYGVKLTIPAKGEGYDILLLGPADQVAAAKHDILENLPVERTYLMEQCLIRSIRSSDSVALLDALRRELKVRIQFGTAEVYIEGKKSSCEKALTAIQSILAHRSMLFVPVEAREVSTPLPLVNIEIEISVPEESIGFIAGKQFVNAYRLEKTYGVKVKIPAKGEGNVIVLQGTDADKLADARTDIIEGLTVTLTQPVEPQYVGWIIGYKGEGVNCLINEYDVKSIQFTDNRTMVTIRGKKNRCEAALKAINAIVDKRKRMQHPAAPSPRRDAGHVV